LGQAFQLEAEPLPLSQHPRSRSAVVAAPKGARWVHRSVHPGETCGMRPAPHPRSGLLACLIRSRYGC